MRNGWWRRRRRFGAARRNEPHLLALPSPMASTNCGSTAIRRCLQSTFSAACKECGIPVDERHLSSAREPRTVASRLDRRYLTRYLRSLTGAWCTGGGTQRLSDLSCRHPTEVEVSARALARIKRCAGLTTLRRRGAEGDRLTRPSARVRVISRKLAPTISLSPPAPFRRPRGRTS